MRQFINLVEALNRVANYVIKDDKTYRTFVDDGKKWSMRETDGKIFPDYHSAEQKIDDLKKQFPNRKFFSQEVGEKLHEGKFRVAWGPDQRRALGSFEIDAKNEKAARKIAREYLDNMYFKGHGFKILYTTEIHDPRGYLYHGTTIPRLFKILRGNALRPANLRGGHKNGVSTSRSYKVAQDTFSHDDPEFPQYGVVLILDKAKLVQKYKIVPYDDIGDDSEEEEQIIGTVRPLSAYLVSINIPNIEEMIQDDGFKEYLTDWDGFPTLEIVEQAFQKLINSPALNRIMP